MYKFFLIILLLTSCVEHKYIFVVSPDGSYSVDYNASGDKQDLINSDVPMPTGQGWLVNTNLDSDLESYEYKALKVFKSNEVFPSSFYYSDSIYKPSLLMHPIEIKYSNWYFKESYYFSAEFFNRNVRPRYPKVESVVYNMENPKKGWVAEIFDYLFKETLFRTPLEFNKQGMILTDINQWLKKEIVNVPDSILFADFNEYKEIGLDILMQSISPNKYESIDSLFKQLEDEVRLTLDLIDDEFEFSILLPGSLQSSNADTTRGDTLIWNFSVNNFLNENYVLSASSEYIYSKRIKFLVISTFIIILVCLVIIRKKFI